MARCPLEGGRAHLTRKCFDTRDFVNSADSHVASRRVSAPWMTKTATASPRLLASRQSHAAHGLRIEPSPRPPPARHPAVHVPAHHDRVVRTYPSGEAGSAAISRSPERSSRIPDRRAG